MNRADDLGALFPHAPDVAERESADCGFSKGWGMQFQPREKTIVDMHGHIEFAYQTDSDALIGQHLNLMKRLNAGRIVACLPVSFRPEDADCPLGFWSLRCFGFEELKPYIESARLSGRVSLMLFLHHRNPDRSLLEKCMAEGLSGVKLHNAPVIVEASDPEVWLSREWSEVFSELGKAGKPVLWHVTQRLTDCPYVGGDRNVYWKDGWEKGVNYTNEDLLRIFLEVVRRNPDVHFIGAHQLHLGWERLASLFDQYPNLYIDTSIGCQVNEGDQMYEEDVQQIRSIFIRYADRILFGTDFSINRDTEGEQGWPEKLQAVANHVRFVRQLRLQDDALQKVMHANAENIFCLQAEG